jgi:Protein of unknown function (DUF3168)
MPQSSAIDRALYAVLKADVALALLCPDGVWWDVAKQNARRFVILSQFDTVDEPIFQGRGWEATTYLVKAVERSTDGQNAAAAADRIDDLLEGAHLPIDGFDCLSVVRTGGRVHINEVDDTDRAIRWQHRGALYLITAAPQVPIGLREFSSHAAADTGDAD